MHKTVIIVAGGKGQRMKAQIPKQFIQVNKTPILMRTIKRFYAYCQDIEIITVLPKTQIPFWKQLCEKHDFNIKHSIVNGGETRFHSVLNAVKTIDKKGITAIHDGVRPFISQAVINTCFETANTLGTAVASIPLEQSIRKIETNKNFALNRDNYKIIQTPQVFLNEILIEAYKQEYNPYFTDDASVVESIGKKIHLIKGSKENIKITTSLDIILAESISKTFDF